MSGSHSALQSTSEYIKSMKARRKHRTQILSKGRTGPVPVQGGINQTVILIPTPQASGRTQDVWAPRASDKQALFPKMGSIALIEPDDYGTRAVKKTQGASITDVLAFGSLNGYPEDKDFMPFGVFANAQDLSNPNRDGTGAVQTAGTVTIINHSGDTISPGQLVYVDKPDSVTLAGSSDLHPLVKEMGAHPQKFVPATRPLRWNSERECAKTIEVELEHLTKKNIEDKTMDNIVMSIDAKLKNTMEIKGTSPMYLYGMSYGCVSVLTSSYFNLNKAVSGNRMKVLHEIASLSIDYMGKLGDMAEKHNGYTYEGVNGRFRRYPSNRIVGYMKEFEKEFQQNKLDTLSTEKLQDLVSVLIKKFNLLVIDCYTEIVSFFRSKVIGKALDYALPGKQLTIQMGYYHA